MVRLATVSLLAATAYAQSEFLDAVIEKCGEFLAPDNSYLNCNFNKTSDSYSCDLSCREGFLFAGDNAQDSYQINCKDDAWKQQDDSAYIADQYSCQRLTKCRSTPNADCTDSGAFKALQCQSGDCWCVDSEGVQIPGTLAGPGEATPNCAGYDSPPVASPKLPEHHDWHDACVVWNHGEWYKTFDGQFFGYVADSCQMQLMKTNEGLNVFKLPLINDQQSYDLINDDQKVAGRLTFQGSQTTFFFNGRYYALDETKDAVTLGNYFKVYRKDNAVNVIDLIENIKFVFNNESLLIKTKFGLSNKGLCGSYDANVKNDATNRYNHVISNIGDSADTWRMDDCPGIQNFISAENTAPAMVIVKSEVNEMIIIKEINNKGQGVAVAEIQPRGLINFKSSQGKVLIAEDQTGNKYTIDGACMMIAGQVNRPMLINTLACPVGKFIETNIKCNAFLPVHGSIESKIHNGIKIVTLECDEGYRAESTELYICDLETGEYQPKLPRGGQRYPSCISKSHKCSHLEPPINGQVKCTDNADTKELRCEPKCNDGFEFASAIPMSGYYTCMEGKWNPYPYFPECIKKENKINGNELGQVFGAQNKGQLKPDQVGYCMTWGQNHYRTFDGLHYRFLGNCEYTLVQDMMNSFAINVVNDPNCDVSKNKCSRTIKFDLMNTHIILKQDQDGNPIAINADNEVLTLPSTMLSLHISNIAGYIIIKESVNSIMMKWDGEESIYIKVGEQLQGQTFGLCGTFNHDMSDDLMTRTQGNTASRIVTMEEIGTFGRSWSVGQNCDHVSQEPKSYCESKTNEGVVKSTNAIMLCSYIMDTPCADVIDPTPFFNACKEDVCQMENSDLLDQSPCNAMASYFRECSRHGIHIDWRAEGRCPIQCPAGQEYHVCGSSCAPSCFNPDCIGCNDEHCIDGCHCPFTTYIHGNECLEREDCPCLYGDKIFQPRERLRQDCNQCVCLGGNFHCTKNECDGVCSVQNSKVRTFDGIEYDFNGECTYTLLKAKDDQYSVNVINKDCSSGECHKSLQFFTENESIVIAYDGSIRRSDEVVSTLPEMIHGFLFERIAENVVLVLGVENELFTIRKAEKSKDEIYCKNTSLQVLHRY